MNFEAILGSNLAFLRVSPILLQEAKRFPHKLPIVSIVVLFGVAF